MNRRQQGLFRDIQPPCLAGTWYNPTIIQIMQLERNYYRLLKV